MMAVAVARRSDRCSSEKLARAAALARRMVSCNVDQGSSVRRSVMLLRAWRTVTCVHVCVGCAGAAAGQREDKNGGTRNGTSSTGEFDRSLPAQHLVRPTHCCKHQLPTPPISSTSGSWRRRGAWPRWLMRKPRPPFLFFAFQVAYCSQGKPYRCTFITVT